MASHDEVAHNWAHRTGRARNGLNMYYEGDTIYSRDSHFPIARHVEDRQGRLCVLLGPADGYSVSTGKHKSIVLRALDYGRMHGGRMFSVPNLGPFDNYLLYNFDDYVRRIENCIVRASRTRARAPMHLRCAEELIEEANRYRKCFLDKRRRKALPALKDWPTPNEID